MDVHQTLADLLQNGKRHAATIDAGTTTAAAAGYLTADDQRAVLGLQTVLVEDAFEVCRQILRKNEDALHERALGAATHRLRSQPISQQRADGVDQDGFAGARLAGDDIETGLPLDLEVIDDREVAYREAAQHSALIMVGSASARRIPSSEIGSAPRRQRLRNSTLPAGPLMGEAARSVIRHSWSADHTTRSVST